MAGVPKAEPLSERLPARDVYYMIGEVSGNVDVAIKWREQPFLISRATPPTVWARAWFKNHYTVGAKLPRGWKNPTVTE